MQASNPPCSQASSAIRSTGFSRLASQQAPVTAQQALTAWQACGSQEAVLSP